MTNAIHNPHNKPAEELPIIFGFNNGGSPGRMIGALIAQDGEPMGSHCCSHEVYMPGDLGVLEGHRADRHETFKAKYPDGYRMEFVSHGDVMTHAGLCAAFAEHDKRYPKAEAS